MDVSSFADELLRCVSEGAYFEQVSLQIEGPIASGYAYIAKNYFLRFYFNEKTGTIAFALIQKQQRIWGIDFDNRRDWHLHPRQNPRIHVKIRPLSISQIMEQLQEVL